MIEIVLRHSVQHMVEIVFLAGNALAQARLGQPRNRLHQHIVRALHVCDSLAPRGVGGFGNDGKIVSAFGLKFLPGQPPASGAIPNRNM